jgi:hypothetical protein
MNREDVIRMAREAGLNDSPDDHNPYWTADGIEELERFAKLVADAEREACALLVEQIGIKGYGTKEYGTLAIAASIRIEGERLNKEKNT